MLGVSVETLRRWETEGRLRMERSEGGQRLVDIDEVVAAARRAPQGVDRSPDRRPVRAQPVRRDRDPRSRRDRVAAVVEVIAGPHRLVSLMTAEAVEELGLKVGDEAVCVVKATNVIVEIPSLEGVANVSIDVPRGRPRPSSRVLVAACSSGGASAAAERRARRPPSAAARRPPSAGGRGVELTIYGAASLKGALEAAKTGLRGRQPRHDPDHLDRLLVRARDPDRAGRAGRRLPVGRHDEPAEARRQGPRRRRRRSTFAGNKLTVIVPTDNPAGIDDAGRPGQAGVKVIAAGDEVPITKYATQLVDNLAKEPGYPAELRRRLRRERRVQGGQRQGRRGQARARRGRRGHRLRDRRQGVDKVTTVDVPDSANVAGDLCRRRRQGVQEPGRRRRRSSTGSPGLTARRS